MFDPIQELWNSNWFDLYKLELKLDQFYLLDLIRLVEIDLYSLSQTYIVTKKKKLT